MIDRHSLDPDYRIALILSGGNALGAYQAGAWQAMEDHGIVPDWIAGASAGAINGALICGNHPDDRLAKLRSLWRPAFERKDALMSWPGVDEARRTQAAVSTLATGQPGMFAPRRLYGPLFDPFGSREPSSLYDAIPLGETIAALTDFDRLNAGPIRFSATAVDIESGDDVVFDTDATTVTAAHIRASAALLPAFAPVEIGGRLYGDAGISVNLPLDAVMNEADDRPWLCIAIDLLPLSAPRPQSLGETISRAQDLVFATQSRRAIAAWQAIFSARAKAGEAAAVTLLHVAYTDQAREVSGKAFDFSPQSAATRWRAGFEDLSAALDQLNTDRHAMGRPGLTVLAPSRTGSGVLQLVDWQLAPRRD